MDYKRFKFGDTVIVILEGSSSLSCNLLGPSVFSMRL